MRLGTDTADKRHNEAQAEADNGNRDNDNQNPANNGKRRIFAGAGDEDTAHSLENGSEPSGDIGQNGINTISEKRS